MKYIVVTNHKGGASKSTTTMQICGAYALYKNMNVEIFEFDDENKDSQNFTKSKIKSTQVEVGDGSEITTTLRNLFNGIDKADMRLCDVGGNKTTTIFLDGLKKSRMFKKVDLFIIPMSGGSQDLKNAKKTLDVILEMDKNANIMFCLSRVRNPRRVQFQYGDFFQNKELKKYPYIILPESDCIDLSRKLKKTVYELAQDEQEKENINQKLLEAFDKNDKNSIYSYSLILEILEDSENYKKEVIDLAHQILDEVLNGKK